MNIKVKEIKTTEDDLNIATQTGNKGLENFTNASINKIECPKGISLENITRMNRQFLKASL